MRVFAISSAEGQVRRPPMGLICMKEMSNLGTFCWALCRRRTLGARKGLLRLSSCSSTLLKW